MAHDDVVCIFGGRSNDDSPADDIMPDKTGKINFNRHYVVLFLHQILCLTTKKYC